MQTPENSMRMWIGVVFATSLSVVVAMTAPVQSPLLGSEPDYAPLRNENFVELPIGATRTGQPLFAFCSKDGLDIDPNKMRAVIVGGLDGSAHTTKVAIEVMRRYYADPKYAPLREAVSLSVIPCGNPDGLSRDLRNDNGAGGNPAADYPPTGEFYSSPTNPEAQYLWRWLGMFGPDLVIEFIDGPKTEIIERADLPKGSLSYALNHDKVAGLATIESLRWAFPLEETRPFRLLDDMDFVVFAKDLQASLKNERVPLRTELVSRTNRSALQVCEQLEKVYGHELNSLAYQPAVAVMARLRYARHAGLDAIVTDVRTMSEKYLSGDKPTLTDKSSGSDFAGHILFGELFQVTKDERATKMVLAVADRGFDKAGQPLEAMPTHSEMSDAVFMSCPTLALAGKLTGNKKYYEMCLKHLQFMQKHDLRADGIYRHSPLDETAWGRGNGFPALGLALTLESMSNDSPGRAEVLSSFQNHLKALLKHQDVTGAWHQVIDHPESYREFTCTCMIVYAMARGVREGWLDRATFAPAIAKGWQAIKLRIGQDGTLFDVCTSTGKMKSLREYLDRTAILGRDPRGGAMALLVATEMLHWE